MSMIRNIAGAMARNWKIAVPAAGVVLVGLAWLAFGYFGVHTAFVDDEVAEALPEFDVPATPVEPVAEVASVSGGEAVVEAPAEADTIVDTAAPSDGVAMQIEPTEEAAAADAPAEAEAPVEAPAEPTVAEIVVEASGSFAGTSRYDVVGQAVVLGNGTGQRFLRFEDFESSNGPDLNVYLFNPSDPNDFIDLGDLSGNIGEQNYEIAADVDLERYSEVSIWCVRFGVGFGSADLATA